MGLTRFTIRRVLLAIPVLFLATLITFVISHVIVPNPVYAWAGVRSDPTTIAAIAAQYHLNDPIYLQYYYYMADLLHGDLGISPVSHLPVLQQIVTYLPASIELGVAALMISVIIGIPLGVLSAIWKGRRADFPIRVFYLSGVASPPFLLALLFQLAFSYYFKLLPSSGRLSPGQSPPTHITGMYTFDSLITGNWTDFVNSSLHLVLPSVALALLTFSLITRVTRSSMIETMDKDFVRTAKSKGLPRLTVIYRHTLRNALTSTVTVIGFAVQLLLSGAIVIETIFFWPGLGYYATQSILNLDFPSIMGVTLVYTVIVVTTNLLTDIAYGLLDPRVKLA